MQTIIVDMTPGFRMPTIYYSQGDIGTQFAVDLRSRFGDSLPAGATVTIQATKPSGFGFSEAATSVTNGVAVFTTVAGMTDEAGRFAAELKVQASGVTLFTANFYMNGEATTHPEGTIDGSEETVIPELTELVERAEEAASSVLDRQTVTNTLSAGSQASYTFDEETNTQTFGIPQGEAGAGAAGVTASAYSSSSTYAVGDYVIHNSNLYRCTTAITTAESFTAAHWTQVVLADDVSDLKSEISDIDTAIKLYEPPTAIGETTLGDYNAKTILSNLTIEEGAWYTLTASITTATDANVYIGLYDGINSAYKAVLTINAGQTSASVRYYATFDSDIAYLTLNAGGRKVNYNVSIADDAEHLSYPQENEKHIDAVEAVATTIQNNSAKELDITSETGFHTGAVNLTGIIDTTATGYKYSDLIPVKEGDILYTESSTTPYRVVTAYNDIEVIGASGTVDTFRYTVPSGVNQVRLTIYANQSTIYGTVKKIGYGEMVGADSQRVETALMNHSHTFSKQHPMVTFIDDDGNKEFYTVLLPIMRQYNIPMVSAYMGDSNPDMQSNTNMMTLEQCKEVVRAGGELIVHHNPSLVNLTIEEAEKVILESKGVLEKYGFYSRLLAYSGGESNSTVRAMVSKHFDGAFSGAYPRVSNNDRSNHDCIVQYAIHREPCGGLYYDSSVQARSIQYFRDMIDECIASNGWLVFTMHSWLMEEGKTQPVYGDTDQIQLLKDIIEYIQTLQGNGSDIEIVTASKGFECFGNAFQAGDYLGYWNEQTLTNTPTLGDHSQAGVAINKEGKFDFPNGNAL